MSLGQVKTQTSVHLEKRYAAERRFTWLCRLAVLVGAVSLIAIMYSIFSRGYSAFLRTEILVPVHFDSEILGVTATSSKNELEEADYYALVVESFLSEFPHVQDRTSQQELRKLVSVGAPFELQNMLLSNPDLLGTTVVAALSASSDLDQIHKGNVSRDIQSSRRVLTDRQLAWYDELRSQEKIRQSFNFDFFTRGDSRYPELAGIGGAIVGSALTLILCLLISFPIGVGAAVYLEEFAPRNRWTSIIEVNINNLAAVPSIIFGLLGLAIILNLFGFPRGTPLVGGVVLALMTLPTIIIACRASLKSVPPSIREAALAMGASPVQVILHHVLPLALPGTLTGTIIGLAQALGETAPLLMVGMVAFVVDVPKGFADAASVLPVQIYLWAESAERGFVEKTSAAIMVILVFLIAMNMLAVLLRSKFERRW